MRKKKKSYSCNNQAKECLGSQAKDFCSSKEKDCSCNVKNCIPDKKIDCSCNVKSCIPDKEIEKIDCCKPENSTPKIKKYPCVCEECEIKCEDKCEDLANRAQELFEKALKYENKAIEILRAAKNYEENAQSLSKKSLKILQNAKEADKGSKSANCKAQELMKKSEELCNRARCLYKEANELEKEAKESCENAKCAYEKAENYEAQAKYLYSQALKYDQKVLKCYKDAGEKIKEYEAKAKKCEELINKCSNKLNLEKLDIDSCQIGECQDEIIEVAPKTIGIEPQNEYCNCPSTNYQCSYINPIYDMTPMQYISDMSYQYIDVETPYIMVDEDVENINDVWNNYYMYIQKIMNSVE